jgi:hypothetical protein
MRTRHGPLFVFNVNDGLQKMGCRPAEHSFFARKRRFALFFGKWEKPSVGLFVTLQW